MAEPWRCPICGWDERLDLSHEQCFETVANLAAGLLSRRLRGLAPYLKNDCLRWLKHADAGIQKAKEEAGLIEAPATEKATR
jgi:hypothetical protein